MKNNQNQFWPLSWRFRRAFVPAVSPQLPSLNPLLFSLKTQDSKASVNSLCDSRDIEDSQRGDPDAFHRLVERYQSRVSKLLWKFTRDRSTHEELVQESFVQVYLSLRTYKAHAPFEHWLTRITVRVGYRYWKQSKQHAYVPIQDCDLKEASQASADSMNPHEAAELVHWLLSQLPPRDRLVLTLRYLEQCSVAETAQQTGWTPSLVKVLTHRAKQKLKKLLENTDIEFEV